MGRSGTPEAHLTSHGNLDDGYNSLEVGPGRPTDQQPADQSREPGTPRPRPCLDHGSGSHKEEAIGHAGPFTISAPA